MTNQEPLPPLDPTARKLIDAMEQGFPRVETMTGAEARRRVRAFQESWQVDLEPIDRVEDRRIPGPAGEIPVRIYRPASPGPLPALVGFHGKDVAIGGQDVQNAALAVAGEANAALRQARQFTQGESFRRSRQRRIGAGLPLQPSLVTLLHCQLEGASS